MRPETGRRSPLSFEAVSRSSAPPESVFAVLADGPGYHQWGGPLVRRSSWEREGTPPPGGVGAVRLAGWPRFMAREEIVAYEPPRRLAYVVRTWLPLHDHIGEVTLAPDGEGTKIVWRASLRPGIPGTRRILQASLSRFYDRLANGLAAHAETQH